MSTQKISYIDFAKSIKDKYPEYNDRDDYELAEAMINKFPEYSDRVELKKKDLSQEDFEASLRGYSEVPVESGLEVPSITTDKEPEKPSYLNVVDTQLVDVSKRKDELIKDREYTAWNKIQLEREKKSLEKQLSAAEIGFYTRTGREKDQVTKTPEQLQEELKNLNEQFTKESKKLDTQIKLERDLQDAEDFLIKTKRLLEAPDENTLAAFKEGLLSPLAKDFFTAGVTEMARQYNILDIVNKYREEGVNSLTEEERVSLGAYGMLAMASQEPNSVAYNVGSGVAEMIPYMVQFALTGGVGNLAKGATQELLKVGTKKGIKKAIAQGTAYAVGAAARTPLMTMTQEEFARRRVGEIQPELTDEGLEGKPIEGTEETVGEAAYKAFSTTFAEVFTEELGGAVTKPLGKLANKIGFNNLVKNLDNTVIAKVKDAVKFNGIVGEYSEELMNSYLQAALTGDQKLSEVWDGKEQLETALTVSTVGALFMGTNAITSKRNKDKIELVDNRNKSLENIDEQYRDEVQKISKIEDIEEKSTVMEQYIYEKNLEGDQLNNIVDYLMYDNAVTSMDIAEQEMQSEADLETPETIKKEETAETIPEEKEAVKTEEIKPEAEPKIGEEVIQEKDVEEIKEEPTEYDKFKDDFLSDDVNLNQIDVPLKKTERIAAAKNLREGKMTKQAEILESYLKESFKSGQLQVVQQAAGKLTVKDVVPIESIIKTEKVTVEAPKVEEPKIEKPKKPKAEVVEPLEPTKAKERVRGVEQGIFQAKKSEQQKFVQTLVDANKETYEVLTYEEATEDAKKYIAEKGSVENAYEDLLNKSKSEDLAKRQVARLSVMDYYSRQAIDESVSEEKQNEAVSKLMNMEKAVAREATQAGQASAVLNIWKSKQPEAVLKVEQRKIQEYNEKILKKKISGKTTIEDQVEKVADVIDQESKKIAKDILAKNKKYQAYKNKVSQKARKQPPKKRQVNKERIKKEQDYRKDRLERYKKERGGTLQAGVGFTTEDIEFAGDMLASYVREGYYRLTDLTNKLRDDFKSVGIDLTDEQIKQVLEQEKDGKKLETSLREQEAKITIPSTAKELGNTIDQIIKEHWEVKDELGRTLAEKFVEEAGLTSLEAEELAKIVLDEYSRQIKDKSQGELTKLLGRSPLPKAKAKRKNVIDKIAEATNLGALDSDFYAQLFGEYFGLIELTDQQTKDILKLSDNLQKLRGTGTFETNAAMDLANYMYELYPRAKSTEAINLWIDMAYASLLSGVSTSVLNVVSAGSNIASKPFRDLTNVSKWMDVVRKYKRGEKQGLYNPFGELVYKPALSGIGFGVKEAAKVYKKGGVGNKYIDQVANDKAFKVSELERPKYGEGKRFKPITVKVGNKKFDLNLLNLYKYSGRNLLAQDRLMYNTIHDIEMASVIADKFAKTGLKGKALRDAVVAEVTGRNINQEVFDQRLENDIALYEKTTGKKADKLDVELRKREIMLDMLELTPEERAEIDQLARSNIFTDDRGGLIAHAAYSMGVLANKNPISKAVVKPFVPFTKIVGNVTEYMLDYVPVYGQLRAHGWSPTSIYKKLTKADMMTAQMGEPGTKAYYEQMGRAWLGTTTFLFAMMLGLGNDEDDFIQITGGRNEEGWQKAGRQNVTPNYTLRMGDVTIPYMNVPSLAIPLGVIGNLNDRLETDMSEGELSERLTASLLLNGVFDTVTMTKDMSIVQGVSALTKLVTDVLTADESRWNKIGEEVAKRYLGFASKPLPQNVNLIKQIEKFFDPTSYSRKDIKEILSYSAGIEHFFDINKPSIDQLGDVVETYPGETLLPYTHWFGLKGGDERWKFLSKHNAIPAKIFNTQKNIETTDGFEKRRMTSEEFHDYTKLAGEKYSNYLRKYMDRDDISVKAKEKVFDRMRDKEITRIQDDLNKYRTKANAEAFSELFRWGVAKKENFKAFNDAKKYNAIKSYQTSKTLTIGGKKYVLDKSELYKFNTLATLEYLKRYSTLDKKTKDDFSQAEYTDEYGVKTTFLDTATDQIWRESKKYISDNEMIKFIDLERLKEFQAKNE